MLLFPIFNVYTGSDPGGSRSWPMYIHNQTVSSLSFLLSRQSLFSEAKGKRLSTELDLRVKSARGSWIDIMLTKKKHSFMKSQSYETGFSDHHHLIYTIFKTTFVKLPSKVIKHWDFSKFYTNSFQQELGEKLYQFNAPDYSALHSITDDMLEKHAPLKTKVVRGNDKEHLDGNIQRAIMKRSRLKEKATKSGTSNDHEKYKKAA